MTVVVLPALAIVETADSTNITANSAVLHGVIAVDTSPWRAYEHIERLEHICKIVLASGKY
jgi:ribulose-5-phosphate 4-epimerase/fuculose-1-phosphate aldolase